MLISLLLAAPILASSAFDDTCATAAPAGAATSGGVSFLTRSLDAGETTDYFRIQVNPGLRADIQALFDSTEANIDLRIWNADCSVLLAESATAGDPEATLWLNDTGASAEVVAQIFVAVAPTSSVTYRLRITATQELCDFDDEFEPNDTCATAAVAPSNVGFFYPLTLTPANDDWIRFTIQPTTSMQFNVIGSMGSDVDLELWSADCNTLIDSAAAGPVNVVNGQAQSMDVALRVFRVDSDPMCSTYSIILSGSIGIRECSSVPNTTGNPALIFGLVSSSVSDDAFFLEASTVPSNTVGLYVYGPDAGSTPLGNGLLCVGSNGLVRGPISTGQTLSIQMRVRTSMPAGGQPPIVPGMTLRFQAWFRDAADPTGFGLSDAIRVTFVP